MLKLLQIECELYLYGKQFFCPLLLRKYATVFANIDLISHRRPSYHTHDEGHLISV